MNKKINKTKKPSINSIYPILILVACILMSVGYATVNSVSMSITGDAIAAIKKSVYINEIKLFSNTSSEPDNSQIINFYKSVLQSEIKLSESDITSSITYEIVLQNYSDKSYYYNGLDYELGEDTFSNENIQATLSNIELDEEILPGENKIVYLTFSYIGDTIPENNILKSYINIEFIDVLCPRDGRICDISGHNHHLNVVGATFDEEDRAIVTDGVDDYLYVDNFNWENTDQFTIEFIGLLPVQNSTGKGNLFFESSVNSNNNYGSFYIDTLEYGKNDITLAMKYSKVINHQISDGIIDNTEYRHYAITLNTQSSNKYINMYLDGISKTVSATKVTNSSITGRTLSNYPFYISSRAGTSYFSKMRLKELRIYKVALTEQEIISNYNKNIKEDNLIAHYNFEKK
jgi:hypothetical protein